MAQLKQEQKLWNSKPRAGKVGPAYIPDTEQPADRVLQDGSKPLGMHITAIRKFLSDHHEVATQGLTTSETVINIIKIETDGTKRPYIDKYVGQKDESGVPLVAPATVFVSHAWKYRFVDTVVDAMEQHAEKETTAYFWFDVFTNDQNAIKERDFDWFSNTFKSSIRDIGKVLVILSPWHDPIPLHRAWCLFEISTALIDKDVGLMIYLPHKEVSSMSSSVQDNKNHLIRALTYIQAEKAEAYAENDKNKIFSVIQSSEGGFASVNNHVKTKLREWYVDQLRKMVSETKEGTLLNAVGCILIELGFYDEGLQHIKQSLPTRLSIHGAHHPDVAGSYASMAQVYSEKRDLDKAMEYFQKSLTIRLSVLGENHPDVATSYNSMAIVYKKKGDLENAFKYCQKSLSSTPGENIIPIIYCNMASVCTAKGELDKALEYYQKSLSKMLYVLGENHPDVATLHNNMATVYGRKGDLDKALEYLQKSLSIRLSILGENHPYVETSYINMAAVYRKKGDLDKALEYSQKSLSIRLSFLGENHPDIATSFNNMAIEYKGNGDFDNALEYYQKSLSLKLSALGENHSDIATLYDDMAIVYKENGDLDKALEYYHKSLSIRVSILGVNHPDVATYYNNMALVYKDKGDLDKALGYFQKSVSISLSVLDESHRHVATYYNNMGSLYKDKGDLDKAMEYYQKSLKIRLSVLGKNHPDVARLYNNIANVNKDKR